MSWVNRSCPLREACFTWQPWWVSPQSRRHFFSDCRWVERGCWRRSFVMAYLYALPMHWHSLTGLSIRRLRDCGLCRLRPEILRDKQHSTTPMDSWRRRGYVHWECLAGIQLCAAFLERRCLTATEMCAVVCC